MSCGKGLKSVLLVYRILKMKVYLTPLLLETAISYE